jgi:hypothetical protein
MDLRCFFVLRDYGDSAGRVDKLDEASGYEVVIWAGYVTHERKRPGALLQVLPIIYR